jgi:hypothetical protein
MIPPRVILSGAVAESKDPIGLLRTPFVGSFDFGFAFAQDDKVENKAQENIKNTTLGGVVLVYCCRY